MADIPEGQCCEKCRYYYTTDDTGDDAARCRRYPPVVAPDTEDYRWADPFTFPYEWCGEYAPANPETVTDGCVTLARLVLLGDLTAARALANKLRE